MIICINYSDNGERYIAHMEYSYSWSNETATAVASYLSSSYDEVYVMGFNCNCKELIDEVVLRGCRV